MTMRYKLQFRSIKLATAAVTVCGIIPFATSAASAQDAPEASTSSPGDIIVTARRQEESLRDTPVAVTAFSEEDIERKSLENLNDISLLTPGFTFESFSTGTFGNPIVRGLAQTQLNNPVQNVSTFLDGIYLQNQSMVDIGLTELERVEIVKGPQTALYGRNAFGGAINYVSKRPTNDLDVLLRGTVGTDERYDAQVGLSGPIVEDKILARVGFGYSTFDGTRANEHPLVDSNLGGHEKTSYNAALIVRPTERLELSASYFGNDLEFDTRPMYNLYGAALAAANLGLSDTNCSFVADRILFGFPAPGNQLFCGEVPTSFPLQPNDTRPNDGPIIAPQIDEGSAQTSLDLFTGGLQYDITDNINFSYLYGNVQFDAFVFADINRDSVAGTLNFFAFPPSFEVSTDTRPVTDFKQESHELRLRGSHGRLDWSVGAYLSDTVQMEQALGVAFEPNSLDPEPLAPPVSQDDVTFDDEAWAIFGQVSYEVADGLTINAEGRYTEEDKAIDIRTVAFAPITGPNATQAGTFKYFAPRFIVDYKPHDDVMFYASAAKGVKAGGFNVINPNRSAAALAQIAYDEETNWTYEIGAKGALANNRIFYELALFYIDWSDVQVRAAPAGGMLGDATIITNQGQASSIGGEISLSAYVTDNLTANFAYGYALPEWGDDVIQGDVATRRLCDDIVCPQNGAIGGNQLARTSKHQLNAGAEWRDTAGSLDYFLRADVAYQSRQFLTDLNVGWISDRTLMNVRAGISKGNWSLDIWGRNVLNEDYVSSSLFVSFAPAYSPALGEKATWGTTLSYRY